MLKPAPLHENPALLRTLRAEIAASLPYSSAIQEFAFRTIDLCLRQTEFTRPPRQSDLIDAVSVIHRLAPSDDLVTALALDITCLRLRARMAAYEIGKGPKRYWRATVTDVENDVGRRLAQFFPWLSLPDQCLGSFAKAAMDELEILNDMIIAALYPDNIKGRSE